MGFVRGLHKLRKDESRRTTSLAEIDALVKAIVCSCPCRRSRIPEILRQIQEMGHSRADLASWLDGQLAHWTGEFEIQKASLAFLDARRWRYVDSQGIPREAVIWRGSLSERISKG